LKTCTRCYAQLPLTAFSLRKAGLPGLKAACKECSAADTRARYAANPASRLRYAQESRKDPAVRRRINDRRNATRHLNPALELWRLAKARARLRGIPFDLEVSDVRVPACCPALGIALRWGCSKRQKDESPTLDRVIPALGYVKGNVNVISWRANRIKSDATLAELAATLRYMQAALAVAVTAADEMREAA
jgi:hypothetical protein